eukprot:662218-Rhodomonas_salina.1
MRGIRGAGGGGGDDDAGGAAGAGRRGSQDGAGLPAIRGHAARMRAGPLFIFISVSLVSLTCLCLCLCARAPPGGDERGGGGGDAAPRSLRGRGGAGQGQARRGQARRQGARDPHAYHPTILRRAGTGGLYRGYWRFVLTVCTAEYAGGVYWRSAVRCAEEGGGGQAIAAAGKEVEGLKKKVEEARLA